MAEYRSKGRVVIAVDDTDTREQGGTGGVARAIGQRLEANWLVWGVTRHQLAILPNIPFTAKNSSNVVHLLDRPESLPDLADTVAEWLGELAVEGSEPGLCVAPSEALLEEELGREAKRRSVDRGEVWDAAGRCGVVLRHVREAPSGIVGAFAGACLAAQGDDGRFVQIGRVRELPSPAEVCEVLAAGGDEVRSVEGELVTEGRVLAERLRPALRHGRCVLYCKKREGMWVPVKGAPGDEEEEDRLHGAS